MPKRLPSAQAEAIEIELDRHHHAARVGDTGAAWWTLERAHILSRTVLVLHLRVHWAMLTYALRTFDAVEVVGQAARLLLAPIGEVTGRTPAGNTGRARVSAFAPMPVPADLRAIIGSACKR
jgi:hypothetical protein